MTEVVFAQDNDRTGCKVSDREIEKTGWFNFWLFKLSARCCSDLQDPLLLLNQTVLLLFPLYFITPNRRDWVGGGCWSSSHCLGWMDISLWPLCVSPIHVLKIPNWYTLNHIEGTHHISHTHMNSTCTQSLSPLVCFNERMCDACLLSSSSLCSHLHL